MPSDCATERRIQLLEQGSLPKDRIYLGETPEMAEREEEKAPLTRGGLGHFMDDVLGADVL